MCTFQDIMQFIVFNILALGSIFLCGFYVQSAWSGRGWGTDSDSICTWLSEHAGAVAGSPGAARGQPACQQIRFPLSWHRGALLNYDLSLLHTRHVFPAS